jgi:hypothetical protein
LIIGGITGGLYANSKVDGGGPQIDAEAIKAKMNEAFKSIADSIGATGTDTAKGIVEKFVGSFNQYMSEFNSGSATIGGTLLKIANSFQSLFDNLEIGMENGTIGHTAFLRQLAGGTASGIAMFQRQMALGKISTEQFEAAMDKLSKGAFDALENQLIAGTITNEEYVNTIVAIQAQFDALKPPDISGLNAFMGGDQMPAWIRELSNIESPLETYRRKMEELQMTLADRPDLFAAGAAQLTAELEKSVGAMEELKNPGALMKGSAAAFSQVLKIQNANGGESAADKLLRIQQQALTQQAAQTALQQQIAAATMNQGNMVIAAIN